MSEQAIVTIITALLASVPPTLFALAAYLAALKNNSKMSHLQRDVNGRIEELIASRVRLAILEERLDPKGTEKPKN